MDMKVIKKHINLYVTDYSLSLGEDGKRAIDKLFDLAKEY
jgi:1,4-dihydroxy-6-naphthoate synthase